MPDIAKATESRKVMGRSATRWCASLCFVLMMAVGIFFWREFRAAPSPGDRVWLRAQEALQVDDLEAARSCLEACRDRWPAHAETQFLLARTARRMDDVAAFERYLVAAETLQWPGEEIALEMLLMRAQAGDLRGTGDRLMAYLAQHPADENLIYEALCLGSLKTQRPGDVLHWAAQWSQSQPQAWQPDFFRGDAYLLMHRTGQAVTEYKKVLQKRPHHDEALLRLANALMAEGQFAEALGAFEDYLGKHPGEANPLIGIANCRFSLGPGSAARQAIANLVEQHPENAAGQLLMGRFELEQGHAAAALPWLRHALKLAPAAMDVLQTLILALRQQGQHAEADKLEKTLQGLRDSMHRIDAIGRELRRDPDQVALRHEAGLLAVRLGREEEAAQWFAGALRLDPRHAPTHQALADLHARQGDAARAERHRRLAAGR